MDTTREEIKQPLSFSVTRQMAKVTTLSRGLDSDGSPPPLPHRHEPNDHARPDQREEQARPDGGGDAKAPGTFFSLALYH